MARLVVITVVIKEVNMQRIGGIWVKKKGKKETMTGSINFGELPVIISRELRIGIFPNDEKEGKQPDFHIVLFPKDEQKGS